MPSVARFMGGWQGHIPLRGEGILFTTSNLPIHMRRRMLNHIASPVSRGEFTQLQRMFKTGRLVSTDGSIDHSARLADLTVPVLAIGGGGDFIVPPGRISPWATVTGSDDVTYRWPARRTATWPTTATSTWPWAQRRRAKFSIPSPTG